MAKGDPIPREHHVSRYCSPNKMGRDGLPTAPAFKMKQGHNHLSVNWLEYFETDDTAQGIAHVRQAFEQKQYALKRDGRFAVLNVNAAQEQVKAGAGLDVRILHWPDSNDPSHSGVFDYTSEDLQVALDLKSLVTPADVYLALV